MKYVRTYTLSNIEDYLQNSHLEFLNGCTPSCQFHSVVPVAFKQNENGVFEAVSYMVILETNEEEIKKFDELQKSDAEQMNITFEKTVEERDETSNKDK